MSVAEPDPKDKRQHERLAMRSSALLVLPNRVPLAVRTFDISTVGIGLVAATNPPERLGVQLRVQVPQRPLGYKEIDVQARVVHSVYSRREDGFRIGLVFLKPSSQALSVIVDYLNK